MYQPFKETKSATMNIFRKNSFLEMVFVKRTVHLAENCIEKVNYLIKTGVFFLLLVIICVPPIIIDSQFFT